MSDFLSKFNKDNYEGAPDKQEQELAKENEATVEAGNELDDQPAAAEVASSMSSRESRRKDAVEEVEIDPTYQKKKRRQIGFIAFGAVFLIGLSFFIYYLAVHVEVDDFVDEPVSEARVWTSENNIEMEITEAYSMEYDPNRIISQSVESGEKMRKGKTIQFVSSLGPDPEEVIPLADFSEMNRTEAETWIAEHKADNLQLVPEYSREVEEGDFLRLAIRDSGIDPSEYRRKDTATVYFSRGEEVFEKDISVPDFAGKAKEEVEQWASTNQIEMTYSESDSNSVETNNIISQSISPEEKIARMDEMEVVISLGKATEVPNFAEFSMEEAIENPELAVNIKQRFHADVTYGQLISQSVEAGTKLTDNDTKEISVTYSAGRPYLKDYRGLSEGDLPRLFYEDYQSKGADIKYIVKYVDAQEIKGTVVGMGKFNEFVPMTHTVEIRISNNASAPAEPPIFEEEDDFDFPPPVEEDEDIPVEEEK